MSRNNGREQYDDRGGAGHNGLTRGHGVRDRERGREDQRGVEEKEEDVISIILAGPYGEVRHTLATTTTECSCVQVHPLQAGKDCLPGRHTVTHHCN